MENVYDVAFGNCFTEMRGVGFYNSDCPQLHVPACITDGQLEGSVYDLWDLFMGVGMFRHLGAFFKNPVRNGHIVSMEETNVYPRKKVTFFKRVYFEETHKLV